MTTPQPADIEAQEALGVASALIKARADRGLTQADLAEQSGVSRSAIKGYETGRNMPGSRELRALCTVLRVSPSMLLFGSEQPFGESHGWPWGQPIPDIIKANKMALALLADLLAPDELQSLVSLMHSLATGRHGAIAIKSDTDESGNVVVELIRSRK